jgi:Mg-chelatase subunit ChlD
MSLANPYALLLLVFLPVPLLLSRRRAARRREVSNLYLWQTSTDSDLTRFDVRSLRRQWLVALQIAIVAATILALARPMVSWRAERVAFVFDLSASMSALDGGATRFDAAREQARSMLVQLPGRSRVRLIAAAASARDLGEYPASELSRELAKLSPSAGAADISGAVALATHSARADRVVVFSDHVSDDVPQSAATPLAWVTVGTAADNMAIASLVARRRPLSPSDGDVLVGVRNYTTHPARAEVEIAQDGKAIGRRTVDIAAGSEQAILLPVTSIGRVITARLLADDALAADNLRTEVVPSRERIRVAFAGRKNFYIEKAIAADSSIVLAPSTTVADVVVCGCDSLPPTGNVLLLPDNVAVSDTVALAISSPDHPIAAGVFFADAVAAATSGVANGGAVVARAGDAPVVVASEHDGRRIVELRFQPSPDMAIGTAFPILVANAVRWLDGRQGNATQVQEGEPLRWAVADTSSAVSVIGPDGKTRASQIADRALTVLETGMLGVYTVRSGGTERQFAINPKVDGESDLRTVSDARTTSDVRLKTDTTNAVEQQPANTFSISRILLLVAAVLVMLEWLIVRRRTVWRAAIAAALAAGAAGLAVVPRAASIDVVAVVDRSRSIPLSAQQNTISHVVASTAALRRGDRLGIVDVGADALVHSELADAGLPQASTSAVLDTDTDIGAGLRLARAMLPQRGERRIVLFSDGRQTIGDAERDAARLAADGIRIDVSRIDAANARVTPVVTRVGAPPSVRANEPFAISIEIKGSPGTRAEMTLYRDERQLDTRQVRVGASGIVTDSFTDKQSAGVHVYRAALRNDDGEDAGAGAVVSVVDEPRVLYVSRAAGVLQSVLASAGFHVVHVGPGAIPRAAALQPYDAVVLDEVSADELSADAASDLAQYVEQSGGGLLLLGNARTLDVAGYPIGPLGASLPIDFRRRSGQRSPAFGLVLVFDKSGSMADQVGGASKIELARQAVMRVLDVLPPSDSLGVIAFDANPVAVRSLAPAPQAADVSKQLQSIAPGGSTRIAPAVTLAAQWLNEAAMRATISKRQVLLISDGQTSPDDEQRLRAEVASAGVEVSSVAIGGAVNRELLQQLAASTGGRAYFPADLSELPKIVAREAARSRSGQLVEEPFVLRSAAHPIVAGIDSAAWPTLGGYVAGAAKPSAASVLTSHLDDPILCAWQFGLGRVAVFTADLQSSWSAPLRAWPNYGRLWAQSVRWVSRGLDDRQLRVTSGRQGKSLRFTLDAEREDGSPIELGPIHATLRSPDEKTADLRFVPSAPGRYVALADATISGAYTLSIAALEGGNGAEHHLVTGVFRGAEQERASQGADDELLARLAATAGGRVLSASDNPFDGPRPRTYQDVSAWVAVAALALYLGDLSFGSWFVAAWRTRRWRPAPGPLTSSAA